MCLKVQIFEEDFKAEREDRERAHSQRNEQEEKFKKEVMRLQSEIEHTRQQLSNHKGNLSGLENVHKERHTEWMHTMDELKKAQEEIRAKTSQVKQYKKQLDTVTAKVKYSVCVCVCAFVHACVRALDVHVILDGYAHFYSCALIDYHVSLGRGKVRNSIQP